MENLPYVRSFFAAMLWRVVADVGVCFGATLRRSAALHSQQKPLVDTWFETPTPTSPKLVVQGANYFSTIVRTVMAPMLLGDEGPDLYGVQVSDRYISNISRMEFHMRCHHSKRNSVAPEITALTAYVRSLDKH